jgi:hypothetical protein
MGILKKINRLFRSSAAIRQLPSGSLTIDRDGHVVTSTVSSLYPKPLLEEIGRGVMALFREARADQMPLTEVTIQFGSLLITGRELRGATIIFLQPQSALSPSST